MPVKQVFFIFFNISPDAINIIKMLIRLKQGLMLL